MEAVILAAGLGTRMKSSLPKILHKIFDKPIIDYVIDCAKTLDFERIFVVVNPSLNDVVEYLRKNDVEIVYQNEPKGTAHALSSALPYLNKKSDIIVLNGDTPLIKTETLHKFMDLFKSENQDIAILSFYPEREHSYGRILRDAEGNVKKIVEITDIEPDDTSIKEANSGIYIIKASAVNLLEHVKENQNKGEFYLTDIVEIAVKRGYKVQAYPLAQEDELIGINTRYELSLAMRYLRDRLVKQFMDNGITFYDPQTVWISPSVKIGNDTVIYPDVFLEGNTTIGQNCIIYQGVRIKDSVIEDNVQIKDCTVIESSHIKSGSNIGPFAHIRPESIIGQNCRIGNFVEVKKSVIGDGTKAAHLSYIGDSEIGNNVNIGAGTITCNYDGKKKHKTTIEDNVFIGSDTQLVAPVKIGKGSYIGAGSTITKDVPPDALAISRTSQKNIEGWARKKREKQ
jgi:bifunctional UDP-N-acetylglucosamine pyrophosphorylase/glucosamine-1-phosphate N-acetyltransferase